MFALNIHFKLISHGSPEWHQAVRLREEVLRKPLGSHFTEGELNEELHHYQVAGFADGELVATAVLVPENTLLKMQRVAVKADIRNLNVGSDMLLFCEELAHKEGYERIYCHARDRAVKFYLKNGYVGMGDYFQEDGVPHLKMSKAVEKKTTDTH